MAGGVADMDAIAAAADRGGRWRAARWRKGATMRSTYERLPPRTVRQASCEPTVSRPWLLKKRTKVCAG